MLTQVNHWLEIIATALDVILLSRVLLLRFYRLYVFITLGCVLSVFFDAAFLWQQADANTSTTLFIYSRFLYAFVFPLIAWDVFEEVKPQVAKLRRRAGARLVTGLVSACFVGFLIAAFFDDGNDDSALFATLGMVAWAGSSTATLGFLWSLQKQIRAQKLELPNNTFVWLIFWELSLLLEVVYCLWLLLAPLVKNGGEFVLLGLSLYGVAITIWCILKLRPIPTGVPSTSTNAGR